MATSACDYDLVEIIEFLENIEKDYKLRFYKSQLIQKKQYFNKF